MAIDIENIIRACVTVFALTLLIITLISYRRSKNVKLLLISAVFVVFIVKGIVLSLGLFIGSVEEIYTGQFAGLLDLLILILLFLATLKR